MQTGPAPPPRRSGSGRPDWRGAPSVARGGVAGAWRAAPAGPGDVRAAGSPPLALRCWANREAPSRRAAAPRARAPGAEPSRGRQSGPARGGVCGASRGRSPGPALQPPPPQPPPGIESRSPSLSLWLDTSCHGRRSGGGRSAIDRSCPSWRGTRGRGAGRPAREGGLDPPQCFFGFGAERRLLQKTQRALARIPDADLTTHRRPGLDCGRPRAWAPGGNRGAWGIDADSALGEGARIRAVRAAEGGARLGP